jgi:hypothetical protein
VRTLAISITAVAILLLTVLVFTHSPASARTWFITPAGTGDTPTIQAGIDSAAAGDTLLLADGEFSGEGNRNIDSMGKAIVITSASGSTVINPRYPEDTEPRRGFIFQSGESPDAVLEGVSVIYAHADTGSAVLCANGSSPTILNCRFSACGEHPVPNLTCGGGMACLAGSSPRVTDCDFYENEATYGADVYCEDSSPTLYGVSFTDGRAMSGAGLYSTGGDNILLGCRFAGCVAADSGGAVYHRGGWVTLVVCSIMGADADYGGGLCLVGTPEGSHADIDRSTFCDNWALLGGGAIFFADAHGNSEIYLGRCTLAYNVSWVGAGLRLQGVCMLSLAQTLIAFNERSEAITIGENHFFMIECTDIYGNEGEDWVGALAEYLGEDRNFSADPLFCSGPAGMECILPVESCSPCLQGNHPDGFLCVGGVGAHGEGCECGAAAEPTTWGAIKAMYR